MKIKIKKRLNIIIFVFAAAISFPIFTYADIVDELKNKISETSDKVKNIEAEIAAYNAQLKKTQSEKNTLNSAIKTLDINKQIITKDISLTQTKIETANSSLEEVEQGIQQIHFKIKDNKEFLKTSIKNMAIDDSVSQTEFLTNVLSSESISDVFDKASQVESFQKSLIAHLQDINKNRDNLQEVQLIKQQQRSELLNLNQELVAKQSIVAQTAAQKASLLKSTKNKEAAYQAELAARNKIKKQLEQEMASYEEDLRVTINPDTLPKTGTKALRYPVAKPVITQYFGNTAFASANSQVYNGSGHNGIDFGVSVGTRIVSAASGVIQSTGDTDKACRGASYGKWVLVRHNNGLSTLYAHLSVISVSPGQAVSSGDIVGLSGNTGYSTGPHLHFTVYATKAVSVISRQSRACGTMMTLPVSPQNGYLNPLSFL